jgi:hypothetical protein
VGDEAMGQQEHHPMTFAELLQVLGLLTLIFLAAVAILIGGTIVILRNEVKQIHASADNIERWFAEHPLPETVYAAKFIDGEWVTDWYSPYDEKIVPLIPDKKPAGLPNGYSGPSDPKWN